MDIQTMAEQAYEAQEAKTDETVAEDGRDNGDNTDAEETTSGQSVDATDEPDADSADETGDEPDDDDSGADTDEGDDSDTGDEDVAEQIDAAKTKVEELPPINRFIYDELPQITTRGVIDGKDVTIQVKTADEIPEGFDWKTKREEKLFDQALVDQGARAVDLRSQYQNKQNQQLFAQENNEIQADLSALQAEGIIPKFSMATATTNPEHEGVKMADAALQIYYKTNQEYAQAGRPFRITYRDAVDKYLAQQARTTKTAEPVVKKDNAERKKVAAKVGAGSTGSEKNELKVFRGMTVDDILREHENDF